MAVDISRLRRTGASDRRTWHGAAFIVEALVLLAFLVASLAVAMQLMAAAHERGAAADELSNAVILASNEAEAFAADPASGGRDTAFFLIEGELIEASGEDERGEAPRYEVTRTVQERDDRAGTLFEARIEVSCDGEPVYGIDASRYVSDEGVRR